MAKLAPKIMGNVIRLAPTETQEPGGWLVAKQAPPEHQRDRIGRHVSSTLDNQKYDGRFSRSYRLLTDDQLWNVYVRVPDVRAAVDSIVRRIATWDWFVEPAVGPEDPDYAKALDLSEEVRRFLQAPNEDGETWQELWTKTITDLLIFDAGVVEAVFDSKVVENLDGKAVQVPGDELQEFVSLRGADILPVVDEHGRTLGYQQDLLGSGISVTDPKRLLAQAENSEQANKDRPVFQPRQIAYMRLFPTNSSVLGQPLIEVLINEIITMMRQSEHSMLAFDADEIPPGILVLAGVAGAAADAAKQEFKRMRGKDHKVRVITSPDPNASGAKWVELRHTAKDVDFVNVVREVRRTIWRVFGVLPVEMGASEDIPRAVGAVQLDVGSSHLINPTLEMVEGKVNARMIPLIVADPSLVHLIRFKFDRETELSPEEQRAKSDTLAKYVDTGIMTRNEARMALDLPPVEGGDVATVSTGQGPVPLGGFAFGDEKGPGPDEGGPSKPPGGSGGDSGGVNDDGASSPDEGEEAPGEVEASIRIQRVRDLVRLIGHAEHGAECGCQFGRAVLDEDLPSDWQPRGRFRDVRTMDLKPLFDEVTGYSRAVEPLYDRAEEEVLAIIASAYKPGGMNEDDAFLVQQRISAAIDRLEAQWALAAAPFYRRTAKIGRDAAAHFTALDVLDDWEQRGQQYGDRAIRYLCESGGMLNDLRARLAVTVSALTVRSRPVDVEMASQKAPKNIDPESDEDTAFAAMAAAFVALKHRIKNWAGRLVELANQTMREGFLAGGTIAGATGEPEPVEWWAEWVSVGDNHMCQTCGDLGSDGFVLLSSLPTVPGGDTECGARCRCVLVLWTRAEVQAGRAVPLSGGAP